MEHKDIIQHIEGLFAATDARDWEKVEKSMDQQVLLDYSSMNGNPSSITPVSEIIKAWSAFLPGFDSTHHQLSNFIVKKLDNNTATAHFDGNANHYYNKDAWTVLGTYDLKLKLANSRWLVSEFRFNFLEQSGNTDLPKLAMQKVGRKD